MGINWTFDINFMYFSDRSLCTPLFSKSTLSTPKSLRETTPRPNQRFQLSTYCIWINSILILSIRRSANLEIVDIESNPTLEEKEEDLKNKAIGNDESKPEKPSNLETVQAANEIKDASKINC